MRVSRTIVPVLAVLVLAGCRTYGGHGTVEANNARLRVASDQLSSSAQVASANLQRLTTAGRFDPNVIAEFQDVVDAHAADAEALATVLGESGRLNYRDASRLLGSVITEQREYDNKYQSLLRAMANTTPTVDPDRASRYHIVPAAWFRTAGTPLTVEDVLRNTP